MVKSQTAKRKKKVFELTDHDRLKLASAAFLCMADKYMGVSNLPYDYEEKRNALKAKVF